MEKDRGLIRKTAYLAIRSGMDLKTFRDQMVRAYIREAMQESRGNRSKCAKSVGVHRNTLYRWALTTPGGKQDEVSAGR